MTIDLPQIDAPPSGQKLARQALLLTRVSVIALTTALMPLTLGNLHKPLMAKAAFAQSTDDDGTPDQGPGDAPGTPGAGGADDDDGTPDQGPGDNGQDHDIGDDHGEHGDNHGDDGGEHGDGGGEHGGEGGNSGSGSGNSGHGGGEGGGSGGSGHGGGEGGGDD